MPIVTLSVQVQESQTEKDIMTRGSGHSRMRVQVTSSEKPPRPACAAAVHERNLDGIAEKGIISAATLRLPTMTGAVVGSLTSFF